MTPETAAFGLTAVGCLVLAALTVCARNAVRAAFCFGATSTCVAGLLLQLGAPLLGASQILIGVSGSALSCLVVGVSANLKFASTARPLGVGTVVAAVLCAGLFALLCLILPPRGHISEVEQTGSAAGLLFGDFLLPLLLTGFAFLVVAVGTSVLTKPHSTAGGDSSEQHST